MDLTSGKPIRRALAKSIRDTTVGECRSSRGRMLLVGLNRSLQHQLGVTLSICPWHRIPTGTHLLLNDLARYFGSTPKSVLLKLSEQSSFAGPRAARDDKQVWGG